MRPKSQSTSRPAIRFGRWSKGKAVTAVDGVAIASPGFEQRRNTVAIAAMRHAASRNFSVGERPRRRQCLAYIVAQHVREPAEQVTALAAFLGEDERPEGLVPSVDGQRGLDDLMAQGLETRDGGTDGRRDTRVDGASFGARAPGNA